MTLCYELAIFSFVVTVIGGIIWCAGHYHDKWQKAEKRTGGAGLSLSMAKATITDMQTRQRDVAALDAKYTKELADAQSETDALCCRLDVGGRVLVKGRCPVPVATQVTGTASVGDAGAAELSEAAGRNIRSVRASIQRDQVALMALQEYIYSQRN